MGFKVASRSSTAAHTAEVDSWFETRGHPQTALMREIRDAILSADARVEECIKWSCPTFTYKGNIVSINPQAKKFVSLMFHGGGKIPGQFPQLTGSGKSCKYMRFDDVSDLRTRRDELTEVVVALCDWKSGT